MKSEEVLMREFVAALFELERIYDEKRDEECDYIFANDIDGYKVRDKRIELQYKLLSMPL